MNKLRRMLIFGDGKGGGGRPVVPQTGTWQFKTTPTKGYLIFGHDDDTPDELKIFRMMRGYGFPFTINTEAENLNANLSSDADSPNSLYPEGTEAIFPDGCKVKDLCQYVVAHPTLAEIAQHDVSSKALWKSSKLNDYIDDFYTTYTTGGGTKTKEELKEAIMEKYASTDVDQGAPRVAEQRAILEEAMGGYVMSIGIWGGAPNIIIDGITVGTMQHLASGYNSLSRQNNYYADSGLGEYQYKKGELPYKITRDSTWGATNATAMCEAMWQDRWCMEIFCHQVITYDAAEDWAKLKATLDAIKTYVDAGKIQVITRKDIYFLGEFVDNPIKSISITPDAAEYQIGTTLTDANFVCKATLDDDTEVVCRPDRIVDLSNVDTSTAGGYTVTMYYRGFKTTCIVTVVSSSITLPSDVQNASDGYYQTWRFSDDTDKCYCLYLSENTGGFTGEPTKYSGAWLWKPDHTTNTNMKVYYSNDGSTTWTKLCDRTAASNIKSNTSTYFGEYTFGSSQSITLGEQVHIT